MNAKPFKVKMVMVPAFLIGTCFLAGLQLTRSDLDLTATAVYRSFSDAYHALYVVRSGISAPVSYYVVASDYRALKELVWQEADLLSVSPTSFRDVYAVEIAYGDTAIVERVRESPGVQVALRFAFFCH